TSSSSLWTGTGRSRSATSSSRPTPSAPAAPRRSISWRPATRRSPSRTRRRWTRPSSASSRATKWGNFADMFIAEVVGNAWGVQRHSHLDKQKLLLVRAIDPLTEAPTGETMMALDGGVQAGPGSVVLVVDEGGSARQMLKDKQAPVRTI